MSIEFGLDADMGRAMQEVRDRVAAVQAGFPKDAKAPPSRAGTTTTPAGGQRRADEQDAQPRELSILGDQQVGKRLQRVEGVARVEISGLTVREVRIDLDPGAPACLRRDAGRDRRALREANADQPVGLLTDPVQDACCASKAACATPSSSRAWWWRAAAAWR
jgi:multidrug efflux pump subunit AcrB